MFKTFKRKEESVEAHQFTPSAKGYKRPDFIKDVKGVNGPDPMKGVVQTIHGKCEVVEGDYIINESTGLSMKNADVFERVYDTGKKKKKSEDK